MKLKIQNVTRKSRGNRYCGPAVISAVTGCDTDTAAYHIRQFNGQQAVKGTYHHEIKRVLKQAGIELNYVRPTYTGTPTFAQWLKVSKRPAGKVFLIAYGSHWGLVSGRRYVCGITGKVVSVTDRTAGIKRRARVTSVYELVAPDGVKKLSPAPKKKAGRSYRMSKLKKEASVRGFIIEKDYGFDEPTWYCRHSDEDIDLAVSGGDEHYAKGGDELIWKLEAWIEIFDGLEQKAASHS